MFPYHTEISTCCTYFLTFISSLLLTVKPEETCVIKLRGKILVLGAGMEVTDKEGVDVIDDEALVLKIKDTLGSVNWTCWGSKGFLLTWMTS